MKLLKKKETFFGLRWTVMCLAQTEHTSSNVMVTSFRETLFHIVSYTLTSSETQGQIVGARESLNGRENIARRKVKNGEQSP